MTPTLESSPAALARLTAARLTFTLGGVALAVIVLAGVAPLLGANASGRLEIIDLGAVWKGLIGDATIESTIFVSARLPRVLAALLCGMGLAAAGTAFQAVLRNPLAEPYTLGVSSGSALFAIIAIRLGLEASVGAGAIGLAAMAGAALSVFVVWRLAQVGDSLPPATLLLAGITIAMFCSAASLMVQYTASYADVGRMVRWMMGGLEWMRYGPLAIAAVPIGLGSLVLWSAARSLNALATGDDAAASLGVDPARVTRLAFGVASLIVGACIAIAGPIGFVGLIVPHAVRALVGADHRLVMPLSMLAGGGLLIVCDTLARIVIAPAQLPVGIVTALLGGPFFVYLLVSGKRRGALWG